MTRTSGREADILRRCAAATNRRFYIHGLASFNLQSHTKNASPAPEYSIQPIMIQLQYRNLCYYTSEPQIRPDEGNHHEKKEDLCHNPAREIFIGKAMEFLSRGHGLRKASRLRFLVRKRTRLIYGSISSANRPCHN